MRSADSTKQNMKMEAEFVIAFVLFRLVSQEKIQQVEMELMAEEVDFVRITGSV